jgi:integrase
MKIKRRLLFFVDKEPTGVTDKDGNKTYLPDGKLRLRIRYDSSTVVNFNVGYRANHDKWSKDTQRCKRGTTHGKKNVSASEINREIQRLEDLAENVFKAFEVKDLIPTINEYKEAFNKANGKETGTIKKDGFFDLWDKFVSTEGSKNYWTNATYKKFHTVKTHLQSYNPKLTLKNLTESDLIGFVKHLEKQDLRNSSINKHYSFFRWFLRWSYKNGYYKGTLHSWKPKLKGAREYQQIRVYLDWEELMQLHYFKVPQNKQYLDRVKDVFLFLCFSGIRHSDVYKLQKSDVYKDYISVVTQKTTDSLTIELNNYSRAILDKYKNVELPKDKALPVISLQKMNSYLKELAELAELDAPWKTVYFKGVERYEEINPKYSLLSTHAGRRTFVVNSLALGISPAVILKWTGHSDFKSMKPYIDIVSKTKVENMNKFNEKSSIEKWDKESILSQLIKEFPKANEQALKHVASHLQSTIKTDMEKAIKECGHLVKAFDEILNSNKAN